MQAQVLEAPPLTSSFAPPPLATPSSLSPYIFPSIPHPPPPLPFANQPSLPCAMRWFQCSHYMTRHMLYCKAMSQLPPSRQNQVQQTSHTKSITGFKCPKQAISKHSRHPTQRQPLFSSTPNRQIQGIADIGRKVNHRFQVGREVVLPCAGHQLQQRARAGHSSAIMTGQLQAHTRGR